MKSYLILALHIIGAALLCLLVQATGYAQSYTIRPTCLPKPPCKANTENFGYNDTSWRQWPGQARPEERDAGAVGGTLLPTPPAIPEQQLPHAETVPAKPPIPGATPGQSILPLVPGNGVPAPGTSPRPDVSPAPLGGIDTLPQSVPTPKPEGSGGTNLTPSKDLVPPAGSPPDSVTPKLVTPIIEPTKAPDKDTPARKPSQVEPEVSPSPDPKPAAPSPDNSNKDSSLLRRGSHVVAAKATPMRSDLPIQANWNASLEPESISGIRLESVSLEQESTMMNNPPRSRALEGYCPVQLQENDRWIVGNKRFRLTYQGQEFVFSSDTARKRFEAAPEKYAPVHSGNDVVLVMEENREVPGSVSHSAIWHGRLYLFSNSANLAAFRDDPARYAKAEAPRQSHLQTPADTL